MECMQKHSALMGDWHCDGPDVWQTLCTTGGFEPPPPPPAPTNARNMTVYSSAASVEVFVNGASLGKKPLPVQTRTVNATVFNTWAEYDDVTWKPGNLTAVAYDGEGAAVAVDTRLTCGAAAKLVLSIDSPSPQTGTGSALLADGQDAALIRASVVDSLGNVVHNADDAITFAVKSGSGRLVGTHSGRQDSHGRADSATVHAYHGLARAVVTTTSVAALPAAERALLAQIDLDSDRSGLLGAEAEPPVDIVVEATAPGLGTAEVSVRVSTDQAADGVLAVAAASAGKTVLFD